MNNSNLFKYIFAVVVIILIGYTIYVISQNKTEISDKSLDQTSTLTNIQTELRLAIADMDTINPLLSNNRNVLEVTKIIFDPLVTLNTNYKPEYCLAEEIARTDDITYLVKLKKGILWQDGSNFDAYDVKFTIDLLKSSVNSIYSENLRNVQGVNIVDDFTLTISLFEPVSFFEYNLTFPIMPSKYYEGEDFINSAKLPIGTGMFKISEISSNMIKLVPNELYWNVSRKPMATKINVNLYGSIGEVYSAFKNGEIDLVTVKTDNIEEYVGTLGYNKIEYKSRNYDFLAFNCANEKLSDPVIRKVIGMMIDKNNIINSCLGAGYTFSNFSLDMGNWLYTKDLNVETNTELAMQILRENGWNQTRGGWQKNDNGTYKKIEFSLTVNSNNQARVAVAENIKTQLSNLGIQITIRYLSPDEYADAINNRNYECILTGLQLGYSPNLNTFFANGNLANYYNDEVNEIMNVVSNTSDDGTLHEKYSRLYDIYLEDVPYIGLYRDTDIIIYNQSLVGNITPNSFNIYHNIEKWYRQ